MPNPQPEPPSPLPDHPPGQGGASPPLAALAAWLQRWNFIERARLERELWDAFERGEPIEQLVAQCPAGFRREVWTTTVERIRRIERTMATGGRPPGPKA